MKISRIMLAQVKIPLPRPLRLGPVEIRTRDYVAVRIETDSGIGGDALGYPRGTPLVESISRVASGLIGTDPLLRRAPLHAFEEANATSRPFYSRAISLLDIALWDIAAKAAGLPLYRMLGGLRQSVPVTAVAGYYMDVRSIDEIADEVSLRIDEGYSRVKVMLKGDDPAYDLRYVRAVAERAPGQVAADAHWSWSSMTQALKFCNQIDDAELAFLEDPFVPQDVEFTAGLQSRLRTPIAAGEDVVDARSLGRLARGVSVLRVDATTCGGITGALTAMAAAHLGGCTVLPHVFAPLHVHLACAFPQVEGVEWIPHESGADPLSSLLLRPVIIESGHMLVSEEPGVGLDLSWDRIEDNAVQMVGL
ncbi:L-alanine-DL-glutamate epimerase-like enolase superfamily enzyme [Paraburkholderia sp. BL27I4N3]|uniref:mandelate racemase/muconate lactonizing enzyme family protein n=1 Tax=Paraburkholderia sp. BL27I4N3 TaxID=1938805 RepID=UPI000E378836|nr:mandelate racemase/muconate lactonizing enzyme family protein [Paraburkholderia sp. BL27I4N3]REE07122.1 L-alanine-DL-glutamate epimerase-like enolase superfamily enzyme [Paraburkholderia sp. BL27I4N3]